MITLTETAKNYIQELCSRQQKKFVRLVVKGGGCAGFSYDYEMTDEPDKFDFQVDLDNAGFLVDGTSLLYVAGTNLDYVSDIGGSRLQISNPNEKSSCGCGKSFSV